MESIAWSLMLADGIDQLFVQLALVYGMLRLLPMKHKGVFCAITIAVPILVNTVFYYVWNIGLMPGMVVLFLVAFVLPFVLYEGSRLIRLVAVLATQLCATVAEVLFYSALEMMVMYPLPSGDNYADMFLADIPLWLFMELLRCVLLVAMLVVISLFLKSRTTRLSKREWVYPALMFGQTLLLIVPLFVFNTTPMPQFWGILCAVATGLFLVVDLMLIEVADRRTRKEAEEMAIVSLNQRINAYAAEAASYADQVESLAHFRHDLRNQLTVAMSLVERGEYESARAVLDEIDAKRARVFPSE